MWWHVTLSGKDHGVVSGGWTFQDAGVDKIDVDAAGDEDVDAGEAVVAAGAAIPHAATRICQV